MASLNNLNGMRTYLIGAMDRVPDGGVVWRDQITPILERMNIKVLNPCKKNITSVSEDTSTRDKIHHYKETAQYDKIRAEYGEIRNADLRCVDISDFVIAYIDIDIHMCGSYEEIVTANRQKKPVLTWCRQGKSKAPNWLFFMLPHQHIFNTMEETIDYLRNVDNNNDTTKLKRWFFFEENIND